jgi:hypothetical protein
MVNDNGGILRWDACEEDDLIDLSEDASEELDNMYEKISKIMDNIKRVKVEAAVVALRTVKEKLIILDNAAEETIFKDSSLFDSITRGEPIYVDGVDADGTGIFMDRVGNTEFGLAYYSQNVIGNILSYSQCVDNLYSVDYIKEKDEFTIQPQAKGKRYVFKRQGKLYVCYHSKNCVRTTLAAVNTFKENLAKYTRKEAQRAKEARRYIKRMANIRPTQLIQLIKQGRIKNCDINEYDVARTLEIEGKDLGNLKGKTTRSHPESYDGQEKRAPVLVKEQQIIYIDIMYVNGESYLIGVFKPLDYISIRKLKTRKISDIFQKLKLCIDHIKRSKLQVSIIRCDEESGVDTEQMESYLTEYDPEIELDIAAGTESVGVVERKIRTVKERVRGYLTTLPFITDEVLEEWLIKNIIYYLNWTPTTTSMDERSAMEKLSANRLTFWFRR